MAHNGHDDELSPEAQALLDAEEERNRNTQSAGGAGAAIVTTAGAVDDKKPDQLKAQRDALRQAMSEGRISMNDADRIMTQMQKAILWDLPVPDVETEIAGAKLAVSEKWFKRAKDSFNDFFETAIRAPLAALRAVSLDSPTMRAVYDTALESVNALKGVLDDQYLLWLAERERGIVAGYVAGLSQEAATGVQASGMEELLSLAHTGPVDYLQEQLPELLPQMFPVLEGRDAASEVVQGFIRASKVRVAENDQRQAFRSQVTRLRTQLRDFPDAQYAIDSMDELWEDAFIKAGLPAGLTPMDFLDNVLPSLLAASTRGQPVFFPVPEGDAQGATTALAKSGEFAVFLNRARARLLAEGVADPETFSVENFQKIFEQGGRDQGTASIILGDYLKAYQNAQEQQVAGAEAERQARLEGRLPAMSSEDERRLRLAGVPLPPGFKSNFPAATPEQGRQIAATRLEEEQRNALAFQQQQLEEVNKQLALAGTEVPPELEERRGLVQSEVDRLGGLFPQEMTEEQKATLQAFEGVPISVIEKLRRGESLGGEEAIRFGGSARPDLSYAFARPLTQTQRLEYSISAGQYDDPRVQNALRIAEEGRRMVLEELRTIPSDGKTQAQIDRQVDLQRRLLPEIDKEIERRRGELLRAG